MVARLLVEGWRGINHSYAMVNQYQLLELSRMPIDLYHRDVPYPASNWNQQSNDSGFEAKRRTIISAIPHPRDPDDTFDAIYRIAHPYRFQPAPRARLFVFGTSEAQNLRGDQIVGELDEAVANPEIHVVTPSKWSAAGFAHAGFPDARIHVVPHGIDPAIFYPRAGHERLAFRRALNWRDDEFVLLSLGAMTWNKGIDVLLLAYAALKPRFPQLRLILKDQSSLYGYYAQDILHQLMREQPAVFDESIIRSISFLSANLNLELLGGLYSAADCYVSPYRAEGFNIPPLEAAACGTPVLMTRGGSTDDYAQPSFCLPIEGKLERRHDKVYIEPDVDSLADQLTVLIEQRRTELDTAKATAFISTRFSWAAVTEQLARVLSI